MKLKYLFFLILLSSCTSLLDVTYTFKKDPPWRKKNKFDYDYDCHSLSYSHDLGDGDTIWIKPLLSYKPFLVGPPVVPFFPNLWPMLSDGETTFSLYWEIKCKKIWTFDPRIGIRFESVDTNKVVVKAIDVQRYAPIEFMELNDSVSSLDLFKWSQSPKKTSFYFTTETSSRTINDCTIITSGLTINGVEVEVPPLHLLRRKTLKYIPFMFGPSYR